MILKKVRDGVYRGSRLETGNDFKRIKKLGIKYVLNLESNTAVTKVEFKKMHNIGIEEILLPMSGILPPIISSLELSAYYIKCYQPILVYCKHGVDRTGSVILADRVTNCRWDFNRAYQEMLDEGHHVFWLRWWKRRLRQYARLYGKGG